MLHFAACRILFEKQQNLLILMHILFKALSDGWQLYYYNALIHTRIQKKKKKENKQDQKRKKWEKNNVSQCRLRLTITYGVQKPYEMRSISRRLS